MVQGPLGATGSKGQENPSLGRVVGCRAEASLGKAREFKIIVQELANMGERLRYLAKQHQAAIEASSIMCNPTNPETGFSDRAGK